METTVNKDNNEQMCCVLFADNTHCSSKVLLVLDSSCDTEKVIDAIAEKIWEHEDYGDPEEYDNGSYNKDEIRIAASNLWFYGTDFYAEKTYDTVYRLEKNMQILK
jgi:hypothetical protein